MNMEELNSCFDSITPTKEQKSKMLDAVMKAKVKPVKAVKLNKYKYLSAVAAVLVIGVFAIAYSNMGSVEDDLYLPEVAVEDSNTKGETSNDENEAISVDVNYEQNDEKYSDDNKSTGGKKSALTEAVKINYPELEENVKTGVNTLPKTKNAKKSNEGVQPKNGAASQSIDNTNKNQSVNNVVTDEKKSETDLNNVAVPQTTPKTVPEPETTPKVADVSPKTVPEPETTPKVADVSPKKVPEPETTPEVSDVSPKTVSEPVTVSEPSVVSETIPDANPETTEVTDETNEDIGVSRASGGGGGSACGGFALYTIDTDLDYINNHDVFSALFPSCPADGFELEYARRSLPEKANSVTADFVSEDGRRISVFIKKKDEFRFYTSAVTLEQVKTMIFDSYSEFMVDCGDYYVEYFVYGEFENSEEIYKMVKSSAYFN